MPRAKVKSATGSKSATRKSVKSMKPAKAAIKRTRAKLVVVASKATERVKAAHEKARVRVAVARQKMRSAQVTARKVAGKGRGTRPANPAAALRAKVAVGSSRAQLAALRAAAGGAKKELLAAQRDDKLGAKAQALRAKAAAANAAGLAKVAARVEKSVAKFRAARVKQLGGAEARRAKRRLKLADAKAGGIERRIGAGARRRRKAKA